MSQQGRDSNQSIGILKVFPVYVVYQKSIDPKANTWRSMVQIDVNP